MLMGGVLYEAGVGRGFTCEHFLEKTNAYIRGCDLYIDDHIIELEQRYKDRFNIKKNTLYDDLRTLRNDSIDVFFADNVFEHLCPDEFPDIMKLLYTKMKSDGLLVLIIPNKIVGPGDVSKFFLEMGEDSQGFHFMEQSCKDVFLGYSKYGFENAYSIFRGGRNKWIAVKDEAGFIARLKILLEAFVSALPKSGYSKKLVKLFGLNCYVLRKRRYKSI